MPFVSRDATFLIFLALVVPVCLLLAQSRTASEDPKATARAAFRRNVFLLVASYVFYGWWDVRFLLLILISSAVDFCCALMIDQGAVNRRVRVLLACVIPLSAFALVGLRWPRSVDGVDAPSVDVEAVAEQSETVWQSLAPDAFGWQVTGTVTLLTLLTAACYPLVVKMREQSRRRLCLAVSVFVNLGLLGFFKYFNFFVEEFAALAAQQGWSVSMPVLRVVLPAGISFYTFQTLGYTIDVYRSQLSAETRLQNFMLYVCFFPQLVMGPIERAGKLLKQFEIARRPQTTTFMSGVQLAVWGYFKKAVLADRAAEIVNPIFGNSDSSGTAIMIATYAFAVQIYCDFSGYTDIGRGVARMLGIELRTNFRLPWFATGPRDFWQRWHISLSTWLRDYLYIPMGGSRGSRLLTVRNLLLTMVLGGLWHGANWTFLVWGLFHGLLLMLSHLAGGKGRSGSPTGFGFWLRAALYFQVTCLGWLIFRTQSLTQLQQLLKAVLTRPDFSGNSFAPLLPTAYLLVPLVGFQVYQHIRNDAEPWRKWSLPAQILFFVGLYYAIVFLRAPQVYPFYYFQF